MKFQLSMNGFLKLLLICIALERTDMFDMRQRVLYSFRILYLKLMSNTTELGSEKRIQSACHFAVYLLRS